ncbi:thioredoxin domain-containing protein [Angustibacter aerolatus]
MIAVVVAEGVAVLLLAVLVVGLLRSHALILRALHELGAGLELERGGRHAAGAAAAGGSAGPVEVELQAGVVPNLRPDSLVGADVVGTSLTGEEVLVPVRGEGRRTLVAFLSSGCGVCQTFWSELTAGPVAVPGDARLVVVSKGPDQESSSALRTLAGDRLEVVQSSAAWTDYGVPGSPYFVYVEDGVITGEGSATTWAQVSNLMGQSVADTEDARRGAGRDPSRPYPAGVRTPGGHGGPLLAPVDGPADLARSDRELLGAGIHPGHASLYEPPDAGHDDLDDLDDLDVRDGADHAGHDHADHAGHDHADHAGHDHAGRP